MKLERRTLLITGGTSGIGLELAKQLTERGNVVIVTGRDPGRLAATQRLIPAVHIVQSDVSDPSDIAALHARLVREFPALDSLINNAGIMRNLDVTENRSLDDVTREIDINLSGPIRMIQQFLPHLARRPDALIVNVSSGLAFIPLPVSPIYSATKAALHSYTQSLRVQLRGSRVTVVELAPPAVATALLRAVAAPGGEQKAMDPGVLARRAIVAIEKGRLEIRPGLANVLKAMSRIAPQFMLNQMVRMTAPSGPGIGR